MSVKSTKKTEGELAMERGIAKFVAALTTKMNENMEKIYREQVKDAAKDLGKIVEEKEDK